MKRLKTSQPRKRPLICHVIYRLDYGGLENGLINVINGLAEKDYDHLIITLAGFSQYGDRLREGVGVESANKKEGLDFWVYLRLWRRFREVKPAIVHTRNLSTLEAQLPALLAGVKHRVHGEHGRDMHDLDNTRSRYRILRKFFRFIVQRYVTVSRELEHYLTDIVGIPPGRVTRICNGVDVGKFNTRDRDRCETLVQAPFDPRGKIVIGAVGRMQAVKDPMTLARAFIQLLGECPGGAEEFALVMVGDGPLRVQLIELFEEAGVSALTWLPGSRDDTPALLQTFDVFALPSLAEGISNTILEAMACGLPVVATAVGGNSELVLDGKTGCLVPRADPAALARGIKAYAKDPELRARHGAAGRERACNEFSLDRMLSQYGKLYHDQMFG